MSGWDGWGYPILLWHQEHRSRAMLIMVVVKKVFLYMITTPTETLPWAQRLSARTKDPEHRPFHLRCWPARMIIIIKFFKHAKIQYSKQANTREGSKVRNCLPTRLSKLYIGVFPSLLKQSWFGFIHSLKNEDHRKKLFVQKWPRTLPVPKDKKVHLYQRTKKVYLDQKTKRVHLYQRTKSFTCTKGQKS